jgi:hypothetical protein
VAKASLAFGSRSFRRRQRKICTVNTVRSRVSSTGRRGVCESREVGRCKRGWGSFSPFKLRPSSHISTFLYLSTGYTYFRSFCASAGQHESSIFMRYHTAKTCCLRSCFPPRAPLFLDRAAAWNHLHHATAPSHKSYERLTRVPRDTRIRPQLSALFLHRQHERL